MDNVKHPVRVLHIFGSMVRDGAELRVFDMLHVIDRERYHCDFYTLSGQPGDLDDELRALGSTIYVDRITPGFPRRFRHFLHQTHYDVIHSHVHMFSGFLLRAAARQGTGVRVTHFHTTDDGHPTTLRRVLQRKLMQHWVNKYSTALLGVSEGALAAAWGPYWKQDPRCQVIYNGVNFSPFEAIADPEGVRREFLLPAPSTLYLHVGRLDEQKNHKRLIEIFSAIARADPMAYLLLVGRGGNAIERALRARIAELSLAERVVFTGRRTDVARFLMAADVLVFPSLWEGLPNVVLEGWAAGTPVLASAVPGVIEIAAHTSMVEYLSLERSDQEWAQAAIRLSQTGNSSEARRRARQEIDRSPFNLHTFTTAHCRVWQGERPAS